jgi:hypothetical protein
MCNEIDYKTEMENLLTKESSPSKPSEKMTKPTSLTVSQALNNYPKQSARVDPIPSTSNQSTKKKLNENIILNLNAKQVYMHESRSRHKQFKLKNNLLKSLI